MREKIGLCLKIVLASALLFPACAGDQNETKAAETKEEEFIPFKFNSVSVPYKRTCFIGVISGTWKEMGIQYGERTLESWRGKWDNTYRQMLNLSHEPSSSYHTDSYPWAYHRTPEERGEYYLKYGRRQIKEVAALAPQVIEFFRGVAIGAAEALNEGEYADICSNFEKVALLSLFTNYAHHDAFGEGRGSLAISSADDGNLAAMDYEEREDAASECCGFWVTDGATTGDTYAACSAQSSHSYPGSTSFYWIGVPDDPDARIFWSHGAVGGAGGMSFNDRGVVALSAGGQYVRTQPGKHTDPYAHKDALAACSNVDPYEHADESLAPGINEFTMGWYAVIYSDTAEEAKELFIHGTPEYRQTTGRKVTLRRRGANIVFADASECYCVEQNAHHYRVRKPGDLGERGGNFLVFANHFMTKDGSYDENDVWQPDVTMHSFTAYQDVPGWYKGGWEPDFKGTRNAYSGSSYWRFWSPYWHITYNYGKIDLDFALRDLWALHIGYDENGTAYPPDENGVPTIRGTFCDHYFDPRDHGGLRNKEFPLGKGANSSSPFFNLSTAEVYFESAFPCHYADKDWSYVNLKWFADHR